MIYGENNPILLKFYVGAAKRRLACRVVYQKYAGQLGARGQNAIRGKKKSYEYYDLIDKVRLELVGHGLSFEETTKFFQEAGWA